LRLWDGGVPADLGIDVILKNLTKSNEGGRLRGSVHFASWEFLNPSVPKALAILNNELATPCVR
jgi:hypothetical protein